MTTVDDVVKAEASAIVDFLEASEAPFLIQLMAIGYVASGMCKVFATADDVPSELQRSVTQHDMAVYLQDGLDALQLAMPLAVAN